MEPNTQAGEVFTANVRVRDFPRSADALLERLAAKRNCYKFEIVRLALLEFIERHKEEIA